MGGGGGPPPPPPGPDMLKNMYEVLRIKVKDNLEKEEISKMYNYLDNISKYIYDCLMENKIVFVHCYAGKQRSATIICAYLMKYLNLSYKESSDLMKTKRIVVFTPLPNFDSALRLYEDKLRNC